MTSATHKRIVFWLIAAAMLAAGLIWAFRPQAVAVDLHTVNQGPFAVTVEEEGRTRVREVFVVSAPVMGRARRTELDVGDAVLAQQTVVGEIEPSDPAFLDQRALAEAQAEIASAQAALSLAKAEVLEAIAELEFARSELKRARSLSQSGTISAQAVEDALRTFKTRSAALTTAQAAVRVREHSLERARSRLTSPAATATRRDECDCVVLKAPVSGRVLQIHHESEAVVEAGAALVSLGDPEDLEIVAEMLSSDAVRIQPGMRVIITGWGGDAPLAGQVQRVEPYAFTKVSALGIEEQRVNVIVTFTGDPATWRVLGHGFRVDIAVVTWESDAAIQAPVTALFRSSDVWSAFVVQDGIAHKRTVKVGRRAGLSVQIIDGLRPGEQVVLSPGLNIDDGVRVNQRHADVR